MAAWVNLSLETSFSEAILYLDPTAYILAWRTVLQSPEGVRNEGLFFGFRVRVLVARWLVSFAEIWIPGAS